MTENPLTPITNGWTLVEIITFGALFEFKVLFYSELLLCPIC